MDYDFDRFIHKISNSGINYSKFSKFDAEISKIKLHLHFSPSTHIKIFF